mgnify:CR=1 FL=1
MTALFGAVRWLGERLFSLLHTYRPYERQVLLHLAALRAVVTAGAALVFWSATTSQGWPVALALPATACVAAWASLLSADFIENRLRRWLLGYSYNPFVSAIGEWEGWMGPTDRNDAVGIATWNLMKCGPPPGGNVNPLLSWWGNPGSGSFCHD